MDEIKLRKTDQFSRTEVQRSSVQSDKNVAAKSHSDKKLTEQLSDTVDIGISHFIHEALDPNKLAAERKAKIEKLKGLIEAGEYKPSSEAVATAVNQAISFEILEPEAQFSEE